MNGRANGEVRSVGVTDSLEYSTDIVYQSLQVRLAAGARKNPDSSGFFKAFPAEPDRLAIEPFYPVALYRRAVSLGHEEPVLKLLGRLPEQGKKIGRKPLPLLEQ